MFRLIVALLLLLGVQVSVLAGTDRTADVLNAVTNFGAATTIADMPVLRLAPHVAATQLVGQLTVVNDVVVRNWETDKHPDSLRVVWSIRGLRYLTGKDYRAGTEYVFGTNDTDAVRNQILRLHCQSTNFVSFFGVWMSRESIYLAPQDAQKVIISKWKAWLHDEGGTFVPVTNQNATNWFF